MRCQFWVLGEILFETSGRTDLESSGRLGQILHSLFVSQARINLLDFMKKKMPI